VWLRGGLGNQSPSDELVADGRFRQDLLSPERRAIRVPALRERIEDVREAAYFLGEFCTRNSFRAREIDAEVFRSSSGIIPGVCVVGNLVERMAIRARRPGDHRLDSDRDPLAPPAQRARTSATPPSASGFTRRWTRPTGTSRPPRACSAPNAPACTSESARSG
jgi:transcriptional regulator with GAF, ATPase, and Fis domain